MSKIEKQWYVVRAVGGKEGKVKEYIEAEIRHNHLEDYISQVLIPTEKVYTIRNGKKVSKEKVSYPGYVLVEAAFVGQIPIIIRNTPNVLGFLGDTKEDSRKMIATPLRPQEVARILGRVDEMNAMEEENEIPSSSARPSRSPMVLSQASRVPSRPSIMSARNSRYR